VVIRGLVDPQDASPVSSQSGSPQNVYTGDGAFILSLCPGTFASLSHEQRISALLRKFRGTKCVQMAANTLISQEGRKIWEDILSVSRNLSRMVQLYGKEVEQSRKSSILKTVAAFPYLLRNHIRPGCLCKTVSVDPSNPPAHMMELREYSTAAMETRHEGDKTATSLRASECWVDKRDVPWTLIRSSSRSGEECLDDVAVAYNRPLWVCDRIGKLVMEVPYSSNFSSRERLVLLNSVDKLTNAIGQCERIHQTAVPLNYARHSLRSLTLWLFTLPFALIGDLGLLTAPVTGCIAWIFFGVYQIGYSIEDPFQGSLRLSNLCDAIRYDVLECEKSRLDTVATQDALYKPLGFIDDEDVFLQATPKLVQTNGTWDLVDVAKGSS